MHYIVTVKRQNSRMWDRVVLVTRLETDRESADNFSIQTCRVAVPMEVQGRQRSGEAGGGIRLESLCSGLSSRWMITEVASQQVVPTPHPSPCPRPEVSKWSFWKRESSVRVNGHLWLFCLSVEKQGVKGGKKKTCAEKIFWFSGFSSLKSVFMSGTHPSLFFTHFPPRSGSQGLMPYQAVTGRRQGSTPVGFIAGPHRKTKKNIYVQSHS